MENTTTIDPMCGATLKERDPMFSTEIDGTIHYFCSYDCKKQFDLGMSIISERMAHAGFSRR
jgi:YHS domain-containing protein